MDFDTENPFLLGKIDKEGLTSKSYNEWFTENYNNYDLNEDLIKEIAKTLNNYQITIFMGTWCGDSKLEVPRFYKILEACNYPMEQLNVIALSRKPYMYKKSPNHYEAGLNIHRVPTFIFYKNRNEVNRIIEHPIETLENDILKIITHNNYESRYQIVTRINSILENDGLNGLKTSSKKLIKNFKNKVENTKELNTYGSLLYTNNKIKEAIEVFSINIQLFPEVPNTYMSLANILGITGNTQDGIKILEKAIHLFPDNKDLVENLHSLKTN